MRALTCEQVEQARAEGCVLTDIRTSTSFGAAFVPEALNVGSRESAANWLAEAAPPPAELVLIADHESDVAPAAARFEAAGYTVRGYLEGGVSAWAEAARELDHLPQLSVHSLQHVLNKYDDHVVLDVRTDDERAEQPAIEGALTIPVAQLISEGPPAELDKQRHITAICRSGYRSNIAGSYLKAHGYANTYSLLGGMIAWAALNERTDTR